mmetsp:Transcript_33347/g.53602  ORF Transcript_33347/g.53602 Transcript_33347/m.53602 type:complete len:204 (-) Transcript_33347:472-1083(-)|eukprot:114186-Amorphochlora_amoeboformis.AAC.1
MYFMTAQTLMSRRGALGLLAQRREIVVFGHLHHSCHGLYRLYLLMELQCQPLAKTIHRINHDGHFVPGRNDEEQGHESDIPRSYLVAMVTLVPRAQLACGDESVLGCTNVDEGSEFLDRNNRAGHNTALFRPEFVHLHNLGGRFLANLGKFSIRPLLGVSEIRLHARGYLMLLIGKRLQLVHQLASHVSVPSAQRLNRSRTRR